MKINQSRLSPFPIRETIDTESGLIDTVECMVIPPEISGG